MNALELKKVSKQFGSTQALSDVSFVVPTGQIVGFLGPNGAGKSTTIRSIMDFIRPDSGEILIFDQDAHLHAPDLKQRIGYVPAESTLYLEWTGAGHIAFLAQLRGSGVAAKAKELQAVLGLDVGKKVKTLSTGNKQKLAIILALATQPDLLILDEPTRGLDPLLRTTFHQLLRDYKAQGGTVLLSSHDLTEVEELCDTIAIIHNGKLVQATTIDQLRLQHGHRVKIRFLATDLPDLSNTAGVQNVKIADATVQLTVMGDLNPLLQLLAKHPVATLEVTASSLEEIFVEMYS